MKMLTSALAFLALAATPSALAAQACRGSPVTPGSGFFEGSVAFTDGAFGYGIGGGGMAGQIILSAAVSRVEFDNTDLGENNITGSVGVELPGSDFSVCPAASVGYSWLTGFDGLDVDGFTYTGGVALGKSFGEEVLVTPYGSAALLHVRISSQGMGSETGGLFGAGVNVGTTSFYAGPSVSITTFEGSDPVLGLQAGVVF